MICGQVFVLWLDDPSMQDARVTPFNHPRHTTQLLGGQSALTTGQSSERFLVDFYDKLSAAAGLFLYLLKGRFILSLKCPFLCCFVHFFFAQMSFPEKLIWQFPIFSFYFSMFFFLFENIFYLIFQLSWDQYNQTELRVEFAFKSWSVASFFLY